MLGFLHPPVTRSKKKLFKIKTYIISLNLMLKPNFKRLTLWTFIDL